MWLQFTFKLLPCQNIFPKNDVIMDRYQRTLFSSKRTSKMQQHQKQPLREHGWFPDTNQKLLFAEQPGHWKPILPSLTNKTTCTYPKWSGHTRLAMRGGKKHSTRGKGFIDYFSNVDIKISSVFNALCNSIKWYLSIDSQTSAWIATIILITWPFYSIYSSWRVWTFERLHKVARAGEHALFVTFYL